EEKFPNNSCFRKKLTSIYQKMGYELAFFENSYQHYKAICFLGNNGIGIQHHLHVGDVVTLVSEALKNSENLSYKRS
ncbi:3065_t:CDS:2, partial [Racocetra fulgida]